MTIIYALIDPITSECRYVGKTRTGADNRLRGHISARHPTYSSQWVHSLKKKGYYPEIVELEAGLSEQEWPSAEQFWIEYFRFLGARLTNHSKGGHDFVKKKAPYQRPMSEQDFKDQQRYIAAILNQQLTGHQYRIWWLLFWSQEKYTQKQIYDKIGIPQQSLSPALKVLAEKKLVAKCEEVQRGKGQGRSANMYQVNPYFKRSGSRKPRPNKIPAE